MKKIIAILKQPKAWKLGIVLLSFAGISLSPQVQQVLVDLGPAAVSIVDDAP